MNENEKKDVEQISDADKQRMERAQQEIEALATSIALQNEVLRARQQTFAALRELMQERYHLQQSDQILTDGTIQRAPQTPPPTPPVPQIAARVE